MGYLEYPFIPVSILINQQKVIELDYWSMKPTLLSYANIIYGEVHFQFSFPDIEDECFYSISSGKLVSKKCFNLYEILHNDNYQKKRVIDGSLNIDVWGNIRAKFFKSSRLFDVEFMYD